MRHFTVCGLLACFALTAFAGGIRIERGELDGAAFALARPAQWNGRVLLLAHGFRPEDRPLVADLSIEHAAYRRLLDAGWIVAKTSYRRNGVIIRDAIADLDALREYIAQTSGAPERVILEGDSMGGLIVTLIAESGDPHYSGAVAVGAALSVREPGKPFTLSGRPRLPLLFLTNRSELAEPRAYVESGAARPEVHAQPALFVVQRDGHVNVNQRERLTALHALIGWIDHGRDSLTPPAPGAAFYDATAKPDAMPSRVTPSENGRGFTTSVLETSAVYGNVLLAAQPGDFAAAGIAPRTWFRLLAGKRSFRVFYGQGFSSVRRGEWVAFPNADGWVWLGRNFGDAAASAQLGEGDRVTLQAFTPE